LIVTVVTAVLLVATALVAWRVLGPGFEATGGAASGDSAPPADQPPRSGDGESPASSAIEKDSVRPPPDEIELIDLPVEDVAKRSGLAGLAGHRLFIAHSQGLFGFDTDSGAVTRFGRSEVPHRPIGRYRDQLILIDEPNRVTAIAAEDPTADPTLLFELHQSPRITAARMIDDNRMVVSTCCPPPGALTFPRPFPRLLIDLESGDAVPLESSTQNDDLTWVPGGGLFEYVDGRYQHLADGFPLVAAERVVLVRECRGPDDCESRWIDRRTGDVVDRPVPPEDYQTMRALDPDGRVLMINSSEQHRYYDAEHGWMLPSNVVRGTGGGSVDAPVEAVIAGRYLIAPVVPGIVIYDLDQHDGYLLDVGSVKLVGITSVVAVPKPNRWSVSP